MTGFIHQRRRSIASGFTLIELLVVVGVIAIMAAALFGALGGGESAKLQSAQLMMTNLVTNARAIAQTSGRRTRILVHADISPAQPTGRFLRFVAMQQADDETRTTWTTIKTMELPDGVFVVPLRPRAFPGLVRDPDGAPASDWTRPSSQVGEELGSTLFAGNSIPVDLSDGESTASFQGVQFTERGTLARLDGGGVVTSPILLLIALGQTKPRGSVGLGASPVELPDSNKVRGAYISNYAVPFLIDDKGSF